MQGRRYTKMMAWLLPTVQQQALAMMVCVQGRKEVFQGGCPSSLSMQNLPT
jgi:hypothetical protein